MNDSKIMVSVLMCVYKEPLNWIQDAIKSIIDQTYKNLEFIIVNDNPDSKALQDFLDNQAEKDRRIKILKNEINLGLTKSLNIGLRNSSGKYIIRMDADDISMQDRITRQVEFMESHPNVIVCGSKVKFFGRKTWNKTNIIFVDDCDIRGQMLLDSGFAHPSVIIRKKALEDNSLQYDENYKTAQDYKLWLDLSSFGDFANLKDALLKYRISARQISQTHTNDQCKSRNYISSQFRRNGILGCKYTYNHESNRLQATDTNTTISETTIKKIRAYYQRAIHYETLNLKSLLSVSFSRYTKISLKERTLLIAWSLNKHLKSLLSQNFR